MRIDILGVAFDNVTMEQAVERTAAMLAEGGAHYAVTPNAEFVQRAEKDEAFRAALNGADLVLPDGIGVIYASKILKRPLQGRVPGCDFAAALCSWMAQNGKKLFLLGAKPGVAEQAGHNLEQAHPGLTVCGTHDGYFKDDAPVIEQINNSGADVVFVCLGAPKQENWISANCDKLCASVFIGLGGSLDIYAGNSKRAPAFFCRFGLEWLYRLICQPWRIKRMMALPKYILRVIFRGKNINR